MNIYETLKHKKFYKNRFFGFDFSTESKIALINFVNLPTKKEGAVDYHINQFVNTYGINYMIIGGGDTISVNTPIDKLYTFNVDGIKGFDPWQDFRVFQVYLNEMRSLHDIKYMIFQGNCGGAWTALKVAKNVKLESILLTTPAFTMSDLSEQGLDPDEVHAVELRQHFNYNFNASDEEVDTFPVLLNLKNQGIKIDLHWTDRLDKPELPKGEKLSDHYELQRAKSINPKQNLKVHLHQLPHDYHTHNLNRYLIASGKMHRMMREEVHLANAYLNNLNSTANSSL